MTGEWRNEYEDYLGLIQGSQWDAPRGGYHVSGTLIIPVMAGGEPILEGANKLTLTIKDLDAPERVLLWDL